MIIDARIHRHPCFRNRTLVGAVAYAASLLNDDIEYIEITKTIDWLGCESYPYRVQTTCLAQINKKLGSNYGSKRKDESIFIYKK